ncbi:MAG: hypothetical protein AAFR36_31170 [Bacteroidota bacterium]
MNNIPKKVEQLIELWLEDPGAFSLADAAGYEGYGDYLSAFQHGYYMGQPEPASEPPEDMGDKLMRLAEQGFAMMNQPYANSYDSIIELADKLAFEFFKTQLAEYWDHSAAGEQDAYDLGYWNYKYAFLVLRGRRQAFDEHEQEAYQKMMRKEREEE